MGEIYIFLRGGLGNNIYQVAYALILKTKYPDRTIKVVCELSSQVRQIFADGCLDFVTIDEIITEDDYRNWLFGLPISLLRFLKTVGLLSDFCVDKEDGDDRFWVSNVPQKVFVFGYWQFETNIIVFVNSLLGQIRNFLKERDPLVTSLEDTVVIHLRLGDYTSFWNRLRFLQMDQDFYTRAFRFVEERSEMLSKVIIVSNHPKNF